MNANPDSFSAARFSAKQIITLLILSVGYLTLSHFLIGTQPEQFVLVILFNSFYFGSRLTRKLILGFSVFAVYWIIFDFMKAFPNYRFATVHIQSLYNTELRFFGVHWNEKLITPNEYFLMHQHAWMDVLAGLFYLCWIPVPIIFAAVLFFRDRDQFLQFSFTFLTANFVGFIIYYTYPAAPPWYYHEYGTAFIPSTPGNIAGLARFDDYFGVDVFKSIYKKSSNVFAAMPSLHSAYPLVVFYFGLRNRLGFANILLGSVAAGIWVAAIYTSHHYVLDVIVGIACAATGIIIFQLLLRIPALLKLYNAYLKAIV